MAANRPTAKTESGAPLPPPKKKEPIGEFIAVRTGDPEKNKDYGRRLPGKVTCRNRREAAVELIKKHGMPLRVMSLTWPKEGSEMRSRIRDIKYEASRARATARATKAAARLKQKKGKKAAAQTRGAGTATATVVPVTKGLMSK